MTRFIAAVDGGFDDKPERRAKPAQTQAERQARITV